MNIIQIIEKKRDGKTLSPEEISFFMRGCVDGSIPDYQIPAWLMAVYLQGMSKDETFYLTKAMAETGGHLSLVSDKTKVDKHSSGGVGDKTSLIIAPVIAALGLCMPKLSGRGLGHTGGTIDKLESIPGFSATLTPDQFQATAMQCGCAIAGQSGDLAPADKKLYALRDVTGTIGSLPLIASSIMSKKLVSDNDIIVLDVKFGTGAFMKTPEDAEALANLMVYIGSRFGKKISAVVSNMNTPLGYAIGNANEVAEAIQILTGELADSDLYRLSIALCAEILYRAGAAANHEAGKEMAKKAIQNGTAYEKFKEWIALQGGRYTDLETLTADTSKLQSFTIQAEKDGFITQIICDQIGRAACLAGAGRQKTTDLINHHAGICLHSKTGAFIRKGSSLATVYSAYPQREEEIRRILSEAYIIQDQPSQQTELIYKIIR